MDDSAGARVAPALATQAARGRVAALTAQALIAAIYAMSSLALARLVAPEDFGIFGIAFAVIGVLDIAQHGGLILPLVQSRALAESQLATLFWFCTGVGVAQGLVGIAAAPVVAWLFVDSRVTLPIVVLAAGYVVIGLATVEEARVRRRMQFVRLAVIEVVAVALAAIVAIIAAWRGAGFWALVYLQITRQFCYGTMLLLIGGVPRMRMQWSEIAPLLQFGRVMVAFEAIGFLNARLDNLVVAWFAGPAALGFYAKAYEFVGLMTNQIQGPIAGVAHATLSRLQDDATRFQVALSRSLLLNASLGVPFITFIAVHATLFVTVLFGEQWRPSATILRALAPGAVTMTVTAAVGWIFVSLGRARRQLPWAMVSSLFTVAAFCAGAQWGGFGVAAAFSATRVLLLIPTLMFTCHGTGLKWPRLLGAVVRPLASSTLAALVSIAVASMLSGGAVPLALLATVFASAYVVCWLALPGGVSLLRHEMAAARGTVRHA